MEPKCDPIYLFFYQEGRPFKRPTLLTVELIGMNGFVAKKHLWIPCVTPYRRGS